MDAVILLRHHHADTLRQVFDGIDKAHAGILDQEADRRAMGAAAEAVIKLLGGADCEAGGFFVMEGAQPHVIGAALFQLDVTADHVDNINAVEQIGNEGLRDHGDRSA
jgi:hypothetical protein